MTSRAVLPLPMGTAEAAQRALPALARALAGEGPALEPFPGQRPPHLETTPGRLGPGDDDPHDPTALIVSTSGSTGEPKAALLPASALRASAAGTHERLGGPGSWLLALPAHHIAGLQVLLRSIAAGTSPLIMDLDSGFTPQAFAVATQELTDRPGTKRLYTSLVPTQLTRLLDAGGAAASALAAYDGVLVGGAATAPTVLTRARDSGIAIVTTYGMSETCGGCVYNGLPLDGVVVRLDDDGRIELGGTVVARGYRGTATPSVFPVDADGRRWFRTDDLGAVGHDGRLTVLGRRDDVIITGGLKVSPTVVEGALVDAPGVAEVIVVGVPDPEWGERVVAVIVPTLRTAPPELAQLRRLVGDQVAAHAAPRQVVVVDAIPSIGPGKPDRPAVRRLVTELRPPTADRATMKES